MKYEVLDGYGSVTNTITADPSFMQMVYPSGNYREVAESAPARPALELISPGEFTRRIGFPVLANIQIFIDGGIPAGMTAPGTLEERATVRAAWEYGRSLEAIDLSSQTAADLLGLLASYGLITVEQVGVLLSGGSIE